MSSCPYCLAELPGTVVTVGEVAICPSCGQAIGRPDAARPPTVRVKREAPTVMLRVDGDSGSGSHSAVGSGSGSRTGVGGGSGSHPAVGSGSGSRTGVGSGPSTNGSDHPPSTHDSEVRAVPRDPGSGAQNIDLARLQVNRRVIVRTAHGGAEPADYQLLGVLGEGGMGVVHAARQNSIGRIIALKTIRAEADSSEVSAKFLVEAAVTGDLDHPNIVPVYELGRDQEGRLFYAMKRVQGRPWSTEIRAMSLADNIEVLLRAADALAFAHARGVIHRDFKPDNVMLGDFGEVLVMDWGLAVAVQPEAKAEQLGPDSVIAGTPSYMAPEMARMQYRSIGVASDIYLLGAVLYEILVGRPPHGGGKLAKVIRAAAANEIPPIAKPSEFTEIALIAMAEKPEDRYPNVKAFQAALRLCQAHGQSLVLSARAQDVLDAARGASDYAGFSKAVFGFEEALALWSGNGAARRCLAAARLAYATCAFDKGDLDLSASLVDAENPAFASLTERLTEARRTRAAAAAAAARLADEQVARRRAEHERQTLEARVASEGRREWHEVFREDFSADGFASRWQVLGGTWELSAGELRVQGGTPQLVLCRHHFSGDLRLEFTCHLESAYLNDISCFLAAVPSRDEITTSHNAYEFKYGGYDNTRIVLNRAGKQLYGTSASPLQRGRRFRVRAERVGAHLTLHVDDELVFDVIDPDPLQGGDRCVLGLFGWVADTWYSDLRIAKLGVPRKADLLDTAELHLSRGHYTTAYDLFSDVLDAGGDRHRLARAGGGLQRAARQRDLSRRLNDVQARILAAWPSAGIEIGDDGLAVTLAGVGATSLDALKGMPICELDCSDNRIVSLEPLRGMALSSLRCSDNRIVSLEPLRGMPLKLLTCARNRIEDITPLRGSALTFLGASGNGIANLEPLRGMPLTELYLDFNAIVDLAALAGMPLYRLHIGRNPLNSLEPLRGMSTLFSLSMTATGVSDLDPLSGQPIIILSMQGCPVRDLEPLRGMRLTRLFFDSCQVESIAALHGMPLIYLSMADNAVASLEPLRGACTLSELDCANNRLASLAPLHGLDLTTLNCSGNAIGSLDPLAGMPLRELSCNRNHIDSLGVLAGLPLERLECCENPLVDLSPIAALPLRLLFCAGTAAAAGQLAALAAGLRARASMAADLVAAAGDLAALRAVAVPLGVGRAALVPWPLPRVDAEALCRRLGGRLVEVGDLAGEAALAALLPAHQRIWAGVRIGDDGDYHALRHLRDHRATLAFDHDPSEEALRAPTGAERPGTLGRTVPRQLLNWGEVQSERAFLPTVVVWDL